jgi:hypothetical protein
MFLIAVANLVTICLGVALVWGWVSFIFEAIARRTGRKPAVPYPDEVLWVRFGRFLLDLGLFGGVSPLPHRSQRAQPRRPILAWKHGLLRYPASGELRGGSRTTGRTYGGKSYNVSE